MKKLVKLILVVIVMLSSIEIASARILNPDEVSHGTKPVLIFYYTTWCGYCKRISPLIDELQNKYSSKVHFQRVNVETNSNFAKKYYPNSKSIPRFQLYSRTGTLLESFVGAKSKEDLEAKIKKRFRI